MKLSKMIGLFMMIGVGLYFLAQVVHGQEKKDFEPYRIGYIKGAHSSEHSVEIYKMMHQGCEIFIIKPEYSERDARIQLGRGCK